MKTLRIITTAMMLLVVGFAVSVYGQSDRGTVRGTVTDPNEAVVAGATVTLTGVETGDSRDVVTNDDGIFIFPEVRAGLYRILVNASGFNPLNITDVKVDVQATVSLNAKLEVGSATGAEVTVTAEGDVINADSPVRQSSISEREVRELPLAVGGESEGRNPLSFIFLDSNISSTADQGNSTNSSKFRVSGGQASGTQILIDGASTIRSQNGTFFSEIAPSPNAFREFTVSTNSFSAEFGNSSGGIVNFTLRSGTNRYNGEAYNFVRNEKFNANDIRKNAQGLERSRDNQNNYGFNIGGPIVVPGFGEGVPILQVLRDKAFFFFHYEGYRFRLGQNSLVTVPTLRMRSGDFSELLNGNDPAVRLINGGNPVLIYDPRQPAATRTPFAGNIIPQSAFDPAGFAILQRFPLPTRPGLVDNYETSLVRPVDTNQFTIKTDFNLSESQRLSVSYSRRDTERIAFDGGAQLLLPLPFTNQGVFQQDFKSNLARIQYDYNISPSLLNHLNIGYTFYDVANANTTTGFNTSSLGIPATATQNIAFPRVGFPGYGAGDPRNVIGLGSSFFDDRIRDGAFEIGDTVTYIAGKHLFKFGANVRFNQFNVRQDIDPGGSFNFRNDQTGSGAADGNGNLLDPNSGYPIASLITGATEFAFNSNNSIDPAFRQITQAYFVQDDIKLLPNLTVNVGLRYDLPGLRTEARDQFRDFDADVINPAIGRAGALVGAGGQSGLQADNKTLARNDKSNIGPRLGAAYAFDEKTVVRGGIGLYYSPILYGTNGGGDINTGTIGYNTTGNLIRPSGPFNRDPVFLRNFPDIPAVNPNNQFVGDLGIPILAFGDDFRTGRTLQYTLDIQRELPYKFVASVGYIGHRADRLRSNFGRINAIPFNALRLGNDILRTDINSVTPLQRQYAQSVGVNIPANGAAVYVERLANGTTRPFEGNVAQALRAFPQYGRVTDILESEGESDYNALQIKLDRRFGQGIQFGASYTYSKLVTNASDDILGGSPLNDILQNPYDISSLKTISPTNSPHVFVTNFLAELPFGKGKRFLNQGGIVDKLIGGFQISGIFRIQQGTPLVFSLDGSDDFLALAGIFGRLRPNLTGQPLTRERVAVPGVDGRFFVVNPAAFSAPPAFNAAPAFVLNNAINPAYAQYYADPNRFFGTAPLVNTDVRSDNFFTEDISILKKTRITETITLELGAEFFNVFNHVLYLPPDTFLGRQDGASGNINSNLNFGAEGFTPRLNEAGNRAIQFRARIIF